MRLLSPLVLALVLVGCERDSLEPEARTPPPARAHASEPAGPPDAHKFGPDTYRTGLFTGEGTEKPGLSCSGSSGLARRCSGLLASGVDGTLLDAALEIPHGQGPHPLVVLLHGWGGSKGSSEDIAGMLLDEGYAVLRYSARGFGRSWGQVNLADLHVELEDLRSLIGQVVDRPGFRLDPGAVAVTGASYGGGQAWLAALEPSFDSPLGAPVRIRTVVPIVPWTDLLYSLLPNGRPRHSLAPAGGLKLSYANALYFSGLRHSPQRPYPNYPDYLVAWHAWMNAVEPSGADPVYRQIADGLAGYRSVWWQQDFWRSVAAGGVPVFLVQGFTDDLFPLPEATRMLEALQVAAPGYPVAAYLGDLGHPRASNKPAEVAYALGLVRNWLAYHLKGEGPIPAYAIHAAITRPREQPFDPADVIVSPSYEALATGMHAREFDGSSVLVNPVTDPRNGFFWDPLVMEAARELEPYPEPPPTSEVVETSLAAFEVHVGELTGGAPLLIAGQPEVSFRAAPVGSRVQLNVRILDVAPDGKMELVTRGTYTLEVDPAPEPVEVTVVTYGNLWRAAADHRLRVEITNVDAPYLTPSRIPSATRISDVRLVVPYRD